MHSLHHQAIQAAVTNLQIYNIRDNTFSDMPLEQAKSNAYKRASKKRWDLETGGITLPNSMFIPTDERTQLVISAAYTKALNNAEFTVPNWKVSADNYITLTAEQIISIADAVSAHIQNCFDLNKSWDESIKNCTTVQEIREFLQTIEV